MYGMFRCRAKTNAIAPYFDFLCKLVDVWVSVRT